MPNKVTYVGTTLLVIKCRANSTKFQGNKSKTWVGQIYLNLHMRVAVILCFNEVSKQARSEWVGVQRARF